MKIGAVLVTSILLVEEIILKKVQAKNILKNFNPYFQLYWSHPEISNHHWVNIKEYKRVYIIFARKLSATIWSIRMVQY